MQESVAHLQHLRALQPTRPVRAELACCITGLMQLQAVFCGGFFLTGPIIIDLRVGYLLASKTCILGGAGPPDIRIQ